MKKVLLTFAFIVSAFSINAQDISDNAIGLRFGGGNGAGGEMQGHNYYKFVRDEAYNIANPKNREELNKFFKNKDYFENIARKNILGNNELYGIKTSGYATRPIDRKENYIKRCVAIPGDTLSIVNGQLYIDGKESNVGDKVSYKHYVRFNRVLTATERETFKSDFGFNLGPYKDISAVNNSQVFSETTENTINMSDELRKRFVSEINSGKYKDLRVDSISKNNTLKNNPIYSYKNIYPNHEYFNWTEDNYGPLWMPKEGVTISLTPENWFLYKRCIQVYEGNESANLKSGKIYINGSEANEYTFKQDYYYMVGDNRHNSADSRMWGFVPADHIVGKGLVIWMSKDIERGWTNGGVRWNRIFKTF